MDAAGADADVVAVHPMRSPGSDSCISGPTVSSSPSVSGTCRSKTDRTLADIECYWIMAVLLSELLSGGNGTTLVDMRDSKVIFRKRT